jgi:hypothetical protein
MRSGCRESRASSRRGGCRSVRSLPHSRPVDIMTHSQLFLILAGLSAILVWRLVLRASAYPAFIPTRTKIIHALILFYVLFAGWSGLDQCLWLLTHSQSSIWSTPPLVAAHVLEGLSGVGLLFVCSGMAKRRKKMVRWYFLLWPILFFSQSFIAVNLEHGIVHRQAIFIGMAMLSGIFILTLAFYILPSAKIIFGDFDHVA